jgi:hypothetical protein
MSRELQHITRFMFGETVAFSVLAKNRGATAADRTPLTSPATQTIRLRISRTPRAAALLTFSTASGHITLGDAATARFDVALHPAAYTSTLNEGRLYYWEIESESAAGVKIGQAVGTITLRRSNGA